MSEPTYRIELQHEPQYTQVPWSARIYRISDDEMIGRGDGSTRVEAFDAAQAQVRALRITEAPSTVYLTEDGDIHDPHDTPTLRSVS